MDDYKIQADRALAPRSLSLLKAEESDIRSAPFYHFHNADYGAFTSGTDPAIISNLFQPSEDAAVRRQPNKVETSIQGLTQLLARQVLPEVSVLRRIGTYSEAYNYYTLSSSIEVADSYLWY